MPIGGVTSRTRVMREIWKIALASFCLVGFAAVVSAAAIAVAGEPDIRAEGRQMMVDAQYNLAHDMRR
jgi:hypothetical protein